MSKDNSGCIAALIIAAFLIIVVVLVNKSEREDREVWSTYDGIIVSLDDNTAHSNNECRGVKYDSYKRLRRDDIVSEEYDSVCIDCFTENERKKLLEHTKSKTTENIWYQIVVSEIRKEFPSYNLDSWGFQMQIGRSAQDFVLYCMRDYLKANSMTEEALMDSLGVRRHEYYDDDDTILHIRYCYHKYSEPPYDSYRLMRFEHDMKFDKEFRRKVYNKLVKDGCNIGDYAFFEAAVMAELYCDSNHSVDY